MKKTYLLSSILICLILLAKGQEKTHSEDNALQYSREIEKKIYNKSLSPSKLNYKLEPIEDGRFKLIFINQPDDYINIEIYDIIGNLILKENREYSLNTEIEYNFNKQNNKIYVVKVKSGDEKMTKKVNF
ncbi:MAG: T9SS type A sorting domain-containing protein [Reichenbachiella sp.]